MKQHMTLSVDVDLIQELKKRNYNLSGFFNDAAWKELRGGQTSLPITSSALTEAVTSAEEEDKHLQKQMVDENERLLAWHGLPEDIKDAILVKVADLRKQHQKPVPVATVWYPMYQMLQTKGSLTKEDVAAFEAE